MLSAHTCSFLTSGSQGTQVAKQMVMSLGMSPEIGQRQLGGQQGGGPFMGRDFMGQGAPPMSQALKQQVVDEAARSERRVVGGRIPEVLANAGRIKLRTTRPFDVWVFQGAAVWWVWFTGTLWIYRDEFPLYDCMNCHHAIHMFNVQKPFLECMTLISLKSYLCPP